jgi:rhodanese-related sulfurtransferase
MKKVILTVVLAVFTTGTFAQTENQFRVIEPEKFEQEIQQEEVQLVDIRTPKEFKEGHIEGARNIDFLAEGFLKGFEALDKEKPLYIYCRSGNRSLKASAILSEAGFENITDLKGGYKAWTAKGKE